MPKSTAKIILVLIIAALTYTFFALGLQEYLKLEYLKSSQAKYMEFYRENTSLTIAVFFLIYTISTALSFPGALVLTLAAGMLFGTLTGTIIVSFASTIGASLAFLAARFVLRDSVQEKFGSRLKTFNEGVEKDGGFYLFTLRLIPVFPFFVINLVMGLTPMKLWTYFTVSMAGMFPGTVVFVFAGTQLAKIESVKDIFSPGLLAAFTIIGIFPFVVKALFAFFRNKKIYAKFKKPKKFDYNLLVIGAGSAGLVSSYIAAAMKSKVALIEKHKMGGDCLNTGCVPSKALIRSAKMLSYAKRAKEFGFEKTDVEFNFSEVMERVQTVITKIEPHDSVERYTKLGVECLQGNAKIVDPFTVAVDDKKYTAQSIIIATGAGPLIPPFPGLDQIDYLTTDTIWNLRELPEKLLILGGGPIGAELAQCFQRFGSQVSLIELSDHILAREDPEVSKIVSDKFESEGMTLLTAHKAKSFGKENGQSYLICENNGSEKKIVFDQVLIALGRKANVKGFGLEELGVELAPRGTVAANEMLQTNYPNIYVCGDVTGPFQFTHTAAYQAGYAAPNALLPVKRKINYDVIPWCTYTDPEIAQVGLNETTAKQQGIDYEMTTYGIDDLDRAIADSEDHGLVKVLTVPGSDKILGATIVGSHAGDLIIEFITAMKHGIGLKQINMTIHIYPTLAESNRFAAGEWSKNHLPTKALAYLEKFFRWRRG